MSRNIPYKQRFQILVTYEVDPISIELNRDEIVFVNWVAEVGGFWAFFAIMLSLVDSLDDVQLYVVSDLIRPYQSEFLSKKMGLSKDLRQDDKDDGLFPSEPPESTPALKSMKTYSPEAFQQECCTGLKIKCTGICSD